MIRNTRAMTALSIRLLSENQVCKQCKRISSCTERVPSAIRNLSTFAKQVDRSNRNSERGSLSNSKQSTVTSGHHKTRTEFLFGVGPCLLALCGGHRKVYKIFINDGALNTSRPEFSTIQEKAEERGIDVIPCTKKKLMKLSEGRPAQNIVIEVSPLEFSKFSENEPTYDTSQVESYNPKTPPPLLLALDEIQDPMNFGAIIRSSLLLGVDKIVVPKRNSAPLSPVVSKASAGAMEVFPIYQTQELAAFLQERASASWEILGAVQPTTDSQQGQQPINCAEYKMMRPTVLVLGNEGRGLSSKVLRECTQLVSIYPQTLNSLDQGSARAAGLNSLNVSVATGILLHSILKNSSSF